MNVNIFLKDKYVEYPATEYSGNGLNGDGFCGNGYEGNGIIDNDSDLFFKNINLEELIA